MTGHDADGTSVFLIGHGYAPVVTVKDGKIASIREYYDPLRVLRAMGEID